ncbi:uncharacterized protein [Haliotis asinina]|uniref:uncharacterized protein n=1 Tax=Haliotis asinina TaxID=109174 RepID=UPI003532635D
MNCRINKFTNNVTRYLKHYIGGHSDTRKDERSGRIAKLLKGGGYPGISSDIVLEAPCFQLREDGEVDRHVFMGLTTTDFVMAVQRLPDYQKRPTIKYRANVDLDVEGMELVCSSPLEFIRFFMIDTRSRTFAVCTSLGSVLYFEMCNSADGSDELWTSWREMIQAQDHPEWYGYRMWTVGKEDAIDARRPSIPRDTKGEDGILTFIRRPLAFCAVDNVGIQSSFASLHSKHPASSSNFQESDNGSHLQKKKNATMPKHSLYSTVKFVIPRVKRSKSRMVYGELKQTQSSTDLSQSDTRRQSRHVVRKNQSEISLGGNTGFTSGSGLHFKYWTLAIMSEALPEEPYRAVDIAIIRFPKWGLTKTSLNQLHKIWKIRNEERLTRERQMTLDLSDSDESITDIFEEFAKAKRKSAPARWTSLKSRRVERPQTLDAMLNSAMFETCGSLKRKEKEWLYGATPEIFAAQLTQIHVDLFRKVTEVDIINFFDKHNTSRPSNLIKMIDFSNHASNLVAMEIVKSNTLADRAQRVKFFIQVGEACREASDLQSAWSVINGLQMFPVAKLTDTWSEICRDFPDIYRNYENLCQMFTCLASPKYRDELQISSQRSPYLPWINHFLWHVLKTLCGDFTKTTNNHKKRFRKVSFAGKLFGKKNSSVQANVLKRFVKPKKKAVSKWATLHRDIIPPRKVKQGDQSVEQHQQQLDSKSVDKMADILASRIITQAISEHSGVNQPPPADKATVSAIPESDSSVQHKTGGFKLNKEKKLIESRETHYSDYGYDPLTSLVRDKFMSDIQGEERIEKMPVDSHHHGKYDVTNTDSKPNESVLAEQDAPNLEPSSGGQDRETELLTRVSLPVIGTVSNTYNPAKRTSHFAQEDDEYMREKDRVIEKAIKFKLKQTKRGDMFKDWTEVEEESSDEVQRPAPEKQKTFFAWRSLFSGRNQPATDTEDAKGTKVVKIRPEKIFTKADSPKQDLKLNHVVEHVHHKMSPSDRQQKSVRFQNQSHSKDDENTNWSSSSDHFCPCVPECALFSFEICREDNGTASGGMIINMPDRQDNQTCQCGVGLMDHRGSFNNGLSKLPYVEATCGHYTNDERSDSDTCHCHNKPLNKNESPDRNWTRLPFTRCVVDENPDGDACQNTISQEKGGMNLDCRKLGQGQDDQKHHTDLRRKDTSCHCVKFDSSSDYNASCENPQIRCVHCAVVQNHCQALNSGLKPVDTNKEVKPSWSSGNKDSLCDVQMYDELTDRKLNNLDRNWSSSSRLSSRQLCWTCDMPGCALHNCGLEKLVELQQTCLTFHLKANSKLKAYINDRHQHLTQYQILRATVSITPT